LFWFANNPSEHNVLLFSAIAAGLKVASAGVSGLKQCYTACINTVGPVQRLTDVSTSIYQGISGPEPEKNTTVIEPNRHRAFPAACLHRAPKGISQVAEFGGPNSLPSAVNTALIYGLIWLEGVLSLGPHNP
jgi:hypothetical protein